MFYRLLHPKQSGFKPDLLQLVVPPPFLSIIFHIFQHVSWILRRKVPDVALVYFGIFWSKKVHSIWSDWSVFILAHSQKLSSMDEPIVRCSFQHFYELFAAISVIHGTGSRAKWFCIVLHSEYVNICQRSRGVCEHEGPRDNHLPTKRVTGGDRLVTK